MLKKRIIPFCVLFCINSYANIQNLQTTKMLSSAGAGTGTLAQEETAFQNPASIAFFNNSRIYYQNNNLDRGTDEGRLKEDVGGSEAFVLSDTSGSVNGTMSYQDQSFQGFKRRRFTGSFARPLYGDTSLGALYSYTDEKDNIDGGATRAKYHQLTLGSTHVIAPNFILGGTIGDVFGKKEDDQRATIGFQYDYKGIIYLIGDFGANYRLGVQDTPFFKTALQFRFFKDFYLRFGRFTDSQTATEGTGWGLSWVGPKLSLHFGSLQTKRTGKEPISSNNNLVDDQTLDEISLSLSLKV